MDTLSKRIEMIYFNITVISDFINVPPPNGQFTLKKIEQDR